MGKHKTSAPYMVTGGRVGTSTSALPEGLVHDWRPQSDVATSLVIPDARAAGDLTISGGGTLALRTVSGLRCVDMTGGKIAGNAGAASRITGDFSLMLVGCIPAAVTAFGRYQLGTDGDVNNP